MIVKLKMNLRLILRFESDSPFSSYFFSLFFTARIKKRGEEGGKEEEEFFISFFFFSEKKRRSKDISGAIEKNCAMPHNFSLFLSPFFPLPPFFLPQQPLFFFLLPR